MNLFEAVRIYVERKRSFGLVYGTSGRQLWSFAREVGDKPIRSIVPRQVSTHLNHPRSCTATWRGKYQLLKHFFEYWGARGVIETLPMPSIRPAVPQTFLPYIYAKAEIRRLLRATAISQRGDSCTIDARTFRMFLLFLYATGALTGEALRLSKEDIDWKGDFISIRGGRFHRSRRIPMGPDLHKRLQRYVRRPTNSTKGQNNFLFAANDGSAMNLTTLAKSFQRLRRLTGIVRRDGSYYQPRMHDLRHTFAVHRITVWFREEADMNRTLPALAAYMGQAGLGSTERYLSLTPERFRKHLVKLSLQRRKGKRWRDDPALMKFLAEL